MKIIRQILPVLLSGFLVISCSKDKDSTGLPASTLAVTTAAPQNVSGLSVTLGGTISGTNGSMVFDHGICWGLNQNPTTADFTKAGGSRDAGTFSFDINVEEPNKLYYVRAYAQNGNGITYGNQVSFTSSYAITSRPVINIDAMSALFRGNTLASSTYTIISRGFCFNTAPSPTANNTNSSVGGGVGDFTAAVSNLQPNTVYYARPFFYTSAGGTFYGEEITFKTTGYFGPAAGYVVYDKGEISEGWRYLEISPVGIDYDITFSPGSKWGCTGSFLSLTYPDIGSGLSNSQRIISLCAQANCAARLCDAYNHNGFSDWFLPSRDEMLLASRVLKFIGISTQGSWTSTENDGSNAYAIDFDLSANMYVSLSVFKDQYWDVYPARRY